MSAPPPPPHGAVPRSSGLPPGKYDIFVIPQHSAGAGFLYLPSLRPNVNSFAAGFASALITVALFQSMAPAFQAWWDGFQGLGNMGITLLVFGVGFGAWALGRIQNDPARGPAAGGGFGATPPPGSPPPPPHGAAPHGSAPHGTAPPGGGPPGGAPPGGAPPGSAPPPPQHEKPKAWQRSPPQTKGSWEKAREETRRKEDERKAKEAEQKRRDEAVRRLAELRAREAKERQEREEQAAKEREEREKRAAQEREHREKRAAQEREHREKQEAREREEREKQEAREREAREREEREKQAAKEREEREKQEAREREAREREAREREAREREAREREQRDKAQGGSVPASEPPRAGRSYAFSSVGEKTNMWPNGRPTVSPQGPPAPTARTCVDDDAHSFRPYDRPKAKARRRPSASGSESSWAPSHTTARTTPPPSVRGPYSTKDPDKVVVQAVYLFMNQFAKTPASQLVSGVGSVTDGLVLRLTTEGLFIDDDVRGVPQREWDVKAWTLKQVEVWCPPHCLSAAAASATPSSGGSPHVRFRARRDAARALTGDDADAFLADMLRACRACCALGLCASRFANTDIDSPAGQAGAWKAKGLHVVRATVRDQEGKRYVFVLDEAESWKVAVGLQRLRRGTQVRQLGVAAMAPSEARGTLETLGWA